MRRHRRLNFAQLCLDPRQSRCLQRHAVVIHQQAAQGFGNLYYTNDESHVIALRNNTDEVVWESNALRLRSVTAPRTLGNYVAVADFEGWLHLLSQVDGHFVSRVNVDGDGVRAPLVTDNDTIYVFGNSGRLTAYSIR